MKSIIILCLLGISVVSAAPKLVFEKYQFEISPLEPDASVSAPSTPLLMSLPPIDGFAPNVNVTIQVFDGGVDKYAELTRSQFQAMKFTPVSESKTEAGDWIVEYYGPFQQMQLHWFSRAVFRSGKVYLITATTPQKEWPTLSEKMKMVVTSFSLKNED